MPKWIEYDEQKSARNKFYKHNRFHENKINVQVSGREKSKCNKFYVKEIKM